MAEVLAEVLDLSQGQTSGRAHHDGEAPLGKGRNTHRLYRTPIDRAHEDDETRLGIAENPHRPPVIPVTGHVVDSDPEEGNGPDDSDEEHGLNYRYRFLEDAQCAGPEERGEETKEAWMTNKSESIRMQNRIAQQSFRTYQYMEI